MTNRELEDRSLNKKRALSFSDYHSYRLRHCAFAQNTLKKVSETIIEVLGDFSEHD